MPYSTIQYAGSTRVITQAVSTSPAVTMNASATMTITATTGTSFPFGARLGPLLIGRS